MKRLFSGSKPDSRQNHHKRVNAKRPEPPRVRFALDRERQDDRADDRDEERESDGQDDREDVERS